MFVAPPKDGGEQGVVTLAEIKEKPFILFRRAVVIDAALRDLTRQIGFEPNVVMENDEPVLYRTSEYRPRCFLNLLEVAQPRKT